MVASSGSSIIGSGHEGFRGFKNLRAPSMTSCLNVASLLSESLATTRDPFSKSLAGSTKMMSPSLNDRRSCGLNIDSPRTLSAKVALLCDTAQGSHDSTPSIPRGSCISHHAPACTHEIRGTNPRTCGPGSTLAAVSAVTRWRPSPFQSHSVVTPRALAILSTFSWRGLADVPFKILWIVGWGTPDLLESSYPDIPNSCRRFATRLPITAYDSD